jgi:two-component system heavy metal sensor histidine kinase CusS
MPTRRRAGSLGTRLAVWYAASAFALAVLATSLLYWAMARGLEQEEIEFLTDKLYTLGVVLRTADAVEIEEEIEQEWPGGAGSRLFVRLLDEAGATLAETKGMDGLGLPATAFPEASSAVDLSGPGVRRGTGGSRSFELRALRLPLGADGRRTSTVQIAADRTADEAFLAGVRRRMAMVLAAALIVSTLVGVGIARRGVRPVSRIGATLRRIRSTTLHERIVPDGLPTELVELASTSNEMLDGLEQAFRQLSRFSADIAHELRTPIHNLRGEVEVALARPRSAEEYRNLLGSCLEECTRLSRLIDSLLFLARAEGRSQSMRPQPLDLGRELAAIAEFYEPLASEAGVALRVVAPPGTRASLDRSLLQSAVGNLIENALAATSSGGSVTVTSGARDGGVRIEVADTGRGIAAAHLPHLFERLYRVDAARGGGAGLGLSIVKGIASLHGGSVSLASQEGAGTRVELWFPATSRAEARQGSAADQMTRS